ncbi:hypothetical protein B9Z55_027375 [Caenorhabditis nigoni]|uniref:DUF7037 domain-containing protein n=1 Tax=Caenorhabditis nigoni TaxID=1611254 RepID=A0A2G5SGU1_9PELO|nr:hypothetical protein B9Z55_027375 [Caenorhabditis nigoni]
MNTETELCKALQALDMTDLSSRGFCLKVDDENFKFYTIEHGLVEMERIDEPTSLGKYYEILVDIKAEYNPTGNSFEIVEIYKEKVPTVGKRFMLATGKESNIDQKGNTYKSAVESCHKPTEVLRKKPKNLSELRSMHEPKKKPNRRILESRKESRRNIQDGRRLIQDDRRFIRDTIRGSPLNANPNATQDDLVQAAQMGNRDEGLQKTMR